MYTYEGKEAVARILNSYVEEGCSLHAAWSRYLTAADVILTDEEMAEINELYEHMFEGGWCGDPTPVADPELRKQRYQQREVFLAQLREDMKANPDRYPAGEWMVDDFGGMYGDWKSKIKRD